MLQSYAQKFLDDESTSQSASDLIHDHNNKFNVGGEFLREEQTRTRYVLGPNMVL